MGCCVSIEDPQERLLQDYQQTVTPEIALHNLHNYLVEHNAQDNAYQAIFDASSVQDSPQGQPYWTKESFRNHITANLPGTSISDTAVSLLWSCFCFYAWHPFPHHDDAYTGKLERRAFERAFILLAYKGTENLGTITTGMARSKVHWAYVGNGRPCTCRHNADRILRSISQLSTDAPESNQNSHMSLSFPKDDMMDVVATTQPNHGKGIPGSDELAAPAQRLLKDKRANYHSRLHIDHLTTLLRMLTRVRLYEPTWGRPNLHYGTLEEPRPQQDELVNILTKQSQISEGFLVPDSVSRVFDILPNMELHFHQLWAIIFQPPVPETSPLLLGENSLPDSTISDILRAVSLFVPPGTQFHGKPEFHRKLRPISFETTYKSSTQESIPNLDLTHLMKGLGDRGSEHRPHLVLFLGDQTQRQGHVPDVIGALCAATPKEESGQQQDISEKTGNSRPSHPQVGPPQLLFQLQPNLRIFRLKEANTASHSSSNGTTKGHVHDMAGKSWIGDSKASGIGLEIDPTTSQMMFVLNQVNQDRNIYNDVLQIDKNSEISGEKLSENIREGFRGSEVVVYRVDGGDEFDPWLANKDGVIRRI